MKHEHNLYLTRTGPGEPMGALLRRYWTPILLASELPQNDCPPVRVKVMSERLLAFRDSAGKLGLIDEFCAHRGVSLWFGRNEDCGLRCPYHGWKFDVAGQCVEVPSEPAESGYAKKIKLKSYPLVEGAGILWTYMGDPALQPPMPGFEWLNLPPGHVFVIDSRRNASAASAGNILITRLWKRGAAGIVTDGGFRDTPEIEVMPFPAYHAQPSAPTNLIKHHAVDLNVPIACGEVPVFPGDIMVGDGEGVAVIPANIADAVADEAFEQTVFEDFVQEKVNEGCGIFGLYPPGPEAREEFAQWRAAHKR